MCTPGGQVLTRVRCHMLHLPCTVPCGSQSLCAQCSGSDYSHVVPHMASTRVHNETTGTHFAKPRERVARRKRQRAKQEHPWKTQEPSSAEPRLWHRMRENPRIAHQNTHQSSNSGTVPSSVRRTTARLVARKPCPDGAGNVVSPPRSTRS